MIEHIVGIDPDIDKSGVAYLERSTRKLEVSSLSFAELIDYFIFLQARTKDVVVVVEAGWLNKGNWHIRYSDNKGQACAKGYQVGRNHETGRKIIEVALHFGFKVEEVKPLKKCWHGKDGKITHEELAYFTGIMGRTNQDGRDAALLAWNYANLPIRCKPIGKGKIV